MINSIKSIVSVDCMFAFSVLKISSGTRTTYTVRRVAPRIMEDHGVRVYGLISGWTASFCNVQRVKVKFLSWKTYGCVVVGIQKR